MGLTLENNTWNGPDRRQPDPDKWHLDKKVPITLIIALLSYGVAGLWAFAETKKDIEILKVNNIEQRDRDRRQDDQTTAGLAIVRSQLERMESKMDRVLEARTRQ